MFITNTSCTTVVREEIQIGMKEVDLRIHKNPLFTHCFAESRECFLQISEYWRIGLSSVNSVPVYTTDDW